jgi:hypothetical protein
MPNARDKEALLRENLLDAGCSPEMTEKCLRCCQSGTLDEMLPALTSHRREVLSEVREKQRQIDCLDYLTNKIKSKEY